MSFEEDLLSLETKLLATSEPGVLTEFYIPIQESLAVISSALDTLQKEGTQNSKEKEQVVLTLEVFVTQSLQTISMWIKCAEASLRTGNLLKWAHSSTFRNENDKVGKAVDEIMTKIDTVQIELLDALRQNIVTVNQQICTFTDLALEQSERYLIRIEIDGSISESSLPHLCTRAWDFEERSEILLSLEAYQTMETNVFRFLSTSEEPPKKCSVKLDAGYLLTFFVATKAVDCVADRVLQANVLSDGKWKLHDTRCQGNYVVFQSENVDAFFILGTPMENEFRVDPSGGQYIHETDKRLRLEFPEGAVTESENFKVKVFPVKVNDMMKRKRMFPEQYKFLSVTKAIHVTGNAFKKPVKVHLPLEQIENAEEDQADFEYVYFHIDGQNVRQMKNQHLRRCGDTIVTDVETFSTYAGAQVRLRSVDSISSMEVLVSFGFMYHCKLMTFVKKVSEEFVQIWCELVKKEDWKELEEKRMQEHPHLRKIKDSDSQDIFIAERQRLRVDVKGNAFVGQEVPKNSLMITFFPIANDNHIFPPLRKKTGMHGVPYSIITYSMDSGKKTSLHTLSFDPWSLPRVRKQNPVLTDRSDSSYSLDLCLNNTTTKAEKDKSEKMKITKSAGSRPSTGHVVRSPKRDIDMSSKDVANKTSMGNVSRPSTAKECIPFIGKGDGQSEEHVESLDPESVQAQVFISRKTKAFYMNHFEDFLEDFEVKFIRDKCIENGIDDLETFLMLEKDDLMNTLGLKLGVALKCIKAQQNFIELER